MREHAFEREGGPENELLQALREALHDPSPTRFPLLVSAFVCVLAEPSDEGAFEEDAAGEEDIDDLSLDGVGVAEFAESLLAVDVAETTAALYALAALTPDEFLAHRLEAAAGRRRQPMPDAVRGLHAARITGAVLMGDELGDGDNVILGVTWPGGVTATLVTLVDHNLGTVVKDCFPVDEPLDVVVAMYEDLLRREGEPVEGRLVPMDVADARAVLSGAVDNGRGRGGFSPEYDWPAPRPFLEMLLRTMPADGNPYAGRPAYPAMSPEEVATGFAASAEARGLGLADGAPALSAVRLLVSHAAAEHGHPLRWSGATVEATLLRLALQGSDADDETLAAVPEVLAPLVRYVHGMLAVPETSRDATLEAVDHWLPVFEGMVADEALAEMRAEMMDLDRLAAGDPGPLTLRVLARAVGGPEALDALDDAPLPREPWRTGAVPDDVRDVVLEVAGQVDRWFEESPDVAALGSEREELLTATRRYLVGVAAGDPAVLRRRARTDITAWAAVSTVGRANRLVGYSPAPLRSKDLLAWFGLSGPATARADTLLRAFGGQPGRGGMAPDLGDPDLLTRSTRARIIRQRDAARGGRSG
ncbi:MAG TPA: hypothetical protein VES95_06020 [Dermatophilaceae bacterium]|nr:hypothetical protein [Dermatophilaceae bacterium]